MSKKVSFKKLVSLIVIASIFMMLFSNVLNASNVTLNKEIEFFPYANKSSLISGIIYVNNDSYDNMYGYDGTAINDLIAFKDSETVLCAANIFEKKSNKIEMLNAISVATILDAKYEIYVNSADGSLDTNKLKKVEFSNREVWSKGYHTIKFEEPIYLTGTKFAIIIKYTSPYNSKMYIPVEVRNNAEFASEGKSFITNDLYSNSWLDLGKNNNAVAGIRAYTLDAKIQFDNIESIEVTKGAINNISIPISTINISNDSILDVKITKESQDVTGNFTEIRGSIVLGNKSTIDIIMPNNIEIGKYVINVSYNGKYNISKDLIIKQGNENNLNIPVMEIEDTTPPTIELIQDVSNKSKVNVTVRDTQTNVIKLKAMGGAQNMDYFLNGGIDIPITPSKEITCSFGILEIRRVYSICRR